MTEAPAKRRILAVAGLIISEGQVLLSQRRDGQSLAHQWEFPGGKIEPGESPRRALVRELHEELGVSVRVGRIWDALYHDYNDFELILLVYPCELDTGQVPQCIDVQAISWCAPSELGNYNILRADRPLVKRLIGEGLPLCTTV